MPGYDFNLPPGCDDTDPGARIEGGPDADCDDDSGLVERLERDADQLRENLEDAKQFLDESMAEIADTDDAIIKLCGVEEEDE